VIKKNRGGGTPVLCLLTVITMKKKKKKGYGDKVRGGKKLGRKVRKKGEEGAIGFSVFGIEKEEE